MSLPFLFHRAMIIYCYVQHSLVCVTIQRRLLCAGSLSSQMPFVIFSLCLLPGCTLPGSNERNSSSRIFQNLYIKKIVDRGRDAGHPAPPAQTRTAAFPHTVLASGNDANTDKRIRMTDTGKRKPPVHEAFHPIPGHSVFLASPLKNFPPQSADLLAEDRQGGSIHGHPIVADVPPYDGSQVGTLFRNRIVHASLQFLIYFFSFACRLVRIVLRRTVNFPFRGLPADMGKPQEVEGLRLSFARAAPVFPRKPAKLQNPCLVRMEFQPKSC